MTTMAGNAFDEDWVLPDVTSCPVSDVASWPVPKGKQIFLEFAVNNAFGELPVDVGIMTEDDDFNFITDDVDIVSNELDCILDDKDGNLILDAVDKCDVKLEDNITVVNLLVTDCAGVVTLGVGVVVLRETSLNVIAGIIPLTTLPNGVIKSRLTAVAVNEYDTERLRLSKDPSTFPILPTTGIV